MPPTNQVELEAKVGGDEPDVGDEGERRHTESAHCRAGSRRLQHPYRGAEVAQAAPISVG